MVDGDSTDALSSMLARWRDLADQMVWSTPYDELFRADPPYNRWFSGGLLNLSVNSLDRHLPRRADQAAILWEGEPGDRRQITFRELHGEVVQLTAALRGMGVGRGDRVALHLGWLPQTVVAMLACARLGAECTVIPVALPVEALAVRLDDFRPKVMFTQDGGWRHGTILPLKARTDEALESTSGVQHTIVVHRTGVQVSWFEGDQWYDDVLAAAPSSSTEGYAEQLPADHPMCAVHLANRRGRPVTVRHGTANLGVSALALHRYGVSEGETFWCAGDVSWLGAQSHGVFGPLLAGASAVMYEGTIDVPAPDRLWTMVERYKVSALLTTPSIVRSLRGWSLTAPRNSTASLRRVTSIGESLDDDLRDWLASVLGNDVVIADGWGQIELGGIVTLDAPADRDRIPYPGFAIVDEDGHPVPNGTPGEWTMRHPWPGTMRGVEAQGDDPTAYHWSRHPGRYTSGDRALRTPAGRVEFLGRVDEVVSVSGQLVSLNEVRDALVEQPFVADAEVVERLDRRLGRSVAAAIVLHPDAPSDPVTIRELQDAVRELLGGLSRPRAMLVVDRFGSELDQPTRRKALAALAASVEDVTAHVTWTQVLAAAGH